MSIASRAHAFAPVLCAVAVIAALPFFNTASRANSSSRQATNEPATFSGTLMDPTGRAWPDTVLMIVDAATGTRREARTDEAGRFSIPGLPPGEYRAEVSRPGFIEAAARLVLAPGQDLHRDVVPQIVTLQQMYTISPHANPSKEVAHTIPQRTVMRSTPPEDPCVRSSTPGCITPPMRMVDARPIFPRVQAREGVSGVVDVSARLGTDGYLKDIKANEGANPDFAAAAVEAMRLWEYSVLRLNGIPQECSFNVRFRFNAGTD
jgi:hypothetical protein